MKNAIMTGANGFIGARVALYLLKLGWQVHAIGRAQDPFSASERILAALDQIDGQAVDPSLIKRLHCHDINLVKMEPKDASSLRSSLSEGDAILFHVAGDTSFRPSDPVRQERINIDAGVNLIRWLEPSLSRVVHVSTAYVADCRREVVQEGDLNGSESFRNTYEASKHAAEIAIRDLCSTLRLPLVVTRPSIVINDTRTGRSSTFTHLNALIEVINRIQEHYGLSDGEVVSRRIRLPIDPDGRPNMIPIDPLVDALIVVALHPRAPGRVFHLCHPSPSTNGELIEQLARVLGIHDKVALAFVPGAPADCSRTEKMIDRSLKVYLPYMNDRCRFDLTNTLDLMPEYAAAFNAPDPSYLKKVIHFQRASRLQ